MKTIAETQLDPLDVLSSWLLSTTRNLVIRATQDKKYITIEVTGEHMRYHELSPLFSTLKITGALVEAHLPRSFKIKVRRLVEWETGSQTT